MSTINMSRALGIAGMGIGVAELAFPHWIGTQLGITARPLLTRAMGAREIASGVGIVARHNPTPAQWTRVIGDVIDIGLLGLAALGSTRKKVVFAVLGAVLAISALDVITARRL
jgi:hypothetical protein